MEKKNLPGLPRKTDEYRTPLRAASLATRASDADDHSRLGHHLPVTITNHLITPLDNSRYFKTIRFQGKQQ